MRSFDESTMEFATMIFETQKVVCYGLHNSAGGTITVMNFPSLRLANKFRDTVLTQQNFRIVQNDAQLVCMADYDTVMCNSDQDPRIKPLTYSRDFMMGTPAHVM